MVYPISVPVDGITVSSYGCCGCPVGVITCSQHARARVTQCGTTTCTWNGPLKEGVWVPYAPLQRAISALQDHP